MLTFYRTTALIVLGLASLTALLAYISIQRVVISSPLFPAHESAIPWKFETVTDVQRGGASSVSVTEDRYSLNYEYYLTEDVMFPYVIGAIAFGDLEGAIKFVDLSEYSTVTFKAQCTPNNMLSFYVHSYDRRVTDLDDFYSYRIASTFFSCNENWSDVEIDLRHLKVPIWWLELANVDVSDQDYWLDKVIAIAFDASRLGPVNTPVKVKISELVLHGHDWRYVWAFAVFSVAVWGRFLIWFFKQYRSNLIDDVREKLRKDQPLIAYQQLSIAPHRDRVKNEVLQFMAAEFANPEMSLELASASLGINRAKINALLKDELGMTFTTYLKKLRLAEAARLLSGETNVNVAETAYSVGYKSVSYFNTVFKNEYGCTPGKFVDLHKPERSE